jgi:dienelactone hydrolase
VEVWGWRDEYIYPQQNKELDENRKKSYLAVVDLASSRLAQLGRTDLPSVETGNEGNAQVALGESDIAYRYMSTWDISAFRDLYVINTADGTSKKIAERVKGNASLSPKAGYVYWFSLPDTSWMAYSVAYGSTVNLTRGLKVRFADEKNDVPDYPGAYGIAGWTKDDQLMIAYDRYDLWALDPQNKRPPVNLTRVGREHRIQFRNIRLDPEERFFDPEKELLLSAFDEQTKAAGFYTLSLKDGKLTKKVMSPHRYGNPVKARLSSRILYTRENYTEFPDLWTSDLVLASPKRITEANPQSKYYNWGSVELVSWSSLDNIPLQGLVFKPENFDAKKKYPMIVYFYETFSDELHVHYAPVPHRSRIMPSMYASQGYLVFIPDIVYKTGYPGESAHNCVMPGVTALISQGFVDEKNIGVQGHSWGGYQSLYLITRTNLFKAAEAGAPVANMISAYGGIRWESGYSRMFQYEHSQSRIGGSFWEKPMQFIENSPIFFADKIQTPLLLLHNDADGAVPWYQGIETYMAMRRLGKPAWMLNYNGEPHWPVKRENRIDFQKRMNQFFDHYLKGAPAPEWMTKGVPAVEKGIRTGY